MVVTFKNFNNMKDIKISLYQYILHGGKLENLDLSKVKTSIGQKYDSKVISNITKGRLRPAGYLEKDPTQLYDITFFDGGTTTVYDGGLEIEVTVVLDSKYL